MRSAYLYRSAPSAGIGFSGLIYFVALLATALAMGAALSHALEMPSKLGLSQEDYFTVQQIYLGWDQLAWLLMIQAGGVLAVAILARHDSTALWFALAALIFLLAAQALFWSFVQPANLATQNWTSAPENWAQLRRQWEYAHVGGAALQVMAMAALTVTALMRNRG